MAGALDEFLVGHAVEGLEIVSSTGTAVVARASAAAPREAAAQVARGAGWARQTLRRARRWRRRSSASALSKDDLADRAKVEAAGRQLAGYIEQALPRSLPAHDRGRGTARAPFALDVSPRAWPSARPRASITRGCSRPHEYEEALSIEQDVRSIGPPFLRRASRRQRDHARDGEALADHLEERGKKGLMISRYKGLGEMNAEELWETTMNPDARTLLQVRVDDAVKTDELFTILMGDQVEPRRAVHRSRTRCT
jgi:DNA gyrase subunit B